MGGARSGFSDVTNVPDPRGGYGSPHPSVEDLLGPTPPEGDRVQPYPAGWRLLDALGQPVIAADLHGRVVYWNDAAMRLYGWTTEGALGRLLAEVGVGDDDTDAGRDLLAAVAAGRAWSGELTVRHRAGTPFVAVVSCTAVRDAEGVVVGVVIVSADITERIDAHQQLEDSREQLASALERERLMRERLGFAAAASDALAASLDPSMTLATLAQIPVPALADWCAIHLLDQSGALQLAAVWHDDPAQTARLREHFERFPPQLHDLYGSGAVTRNGRSHVVQDLPDAALAELSQSPEHLAALRAMRMSSYLAVPLTARHRTLGALELVRESGAPYDDADRALAEDLARRAGLAVDNARLYHDRVVVAEALQRTLLPPELPTIPEVDVAAFYRAAGEGEVGGDFFDVFAAGADRWGVVVGDVSGKGATAAALTGIARTVVRILTAQGAGLEATLAQLNGTFQEQAEEGQFCTVALAALVPWTSGVQATFCIAGHPQPIVRRADGSLEMVGETGTLLGIVPDVELVERSVHLGSGDVLVLYTDGVTERTSAGVMFGTEGLKRVLEETDGMSAVEVATALEQAVVDFAAEEIRDDLAGVVLRVR